MAIKKTDAATSNKKSTKLAAAKVRAIERTQVAKARVAKVPGAKTGSGFLDFIRTQGVIGLAIGLAIGAAAGDTVKKLVEGFINPIVQFIVGSQAGLQTAVWHTELWGRKADFAWGAFVSSAITLVATAFVIYLIIHFLKLDRLDKKKES